MGAEIKWDIDKVLDFIQINGSEFARVKTPRGMRTQTKRLFGNKTLTGKCFRNCMVIANRFPEHFWYCEGVVWGGDFKTKTMRWFPHAWLCPKRVDIGNDATWALDVTWPYARGKPQVDLFYAGVKFNGEFAMKTYLNLRKSYEKSNTVPIGGLSLLSHSKILEGKVKGFKELYAL